MLKHKLLNLFNYLVTSIIYCNTIQKRSSVIIVLYCSRGTKVAVMLPSFTIPLAGIRFLSRDVYGGIERGAERLLHWLYRPLYFNWLIWQAMLLPRENVTIPRPRNIRLNFFFLRASHFCILAVYIRLIFQSNSESWICACGKCEKIGFIIHVFSMFYC